jgi:regulator of cell morphogenesis and NO signaling
MTTIDQYKAMSVGQIATADFRAAAIFREFGIDFCCHGDDDFTTACHKAQVDPILVVKKLQQLQEEPFQIQNIQFANWPIDLLMDYILKIHHRGIRQKGPDILDLLDKVTAVHGERHPELFEVRTLFAESLQDLSDHLTKEEEVLFPYLYKLFQSSSEGSMPEPFHCGSVGYPIEVMLTEHDGEGERYRIISSLTNGYKTPQDACNSYRLVLNQLCEFEQDLHQHIHLENNILFPWAIEQEQKNR